MATQYDSGMPANQLPEAVSAALADPRPGRRLAVLAAGIPFSGLTWGDAAARPLLLLHGVTSSAASFWRVGPALAGLGRLVVAPDMPGHGRTGHWQGHYRFRDNASDMAAFARGAGLARADLQVVGHSWGAMTAAALPAAGLIPATIVLLDPPAIPFERIALEASDPAQRTFEDAGEARHVIAAENPDWAEGDIAAKAEALTELDEAAARSVLLDNKDWDGGLADLADPAAASVDLWIIRGDPAAGGFVPDSMLPAFEARAGRDRVITIAGGPHSPHRTHIRQTTAALVRALDAAGATPGV
jgi:pimeloyl-ACP methyl ester carboxylesterase